MSQSSAAVTSCHLFRDTFATFKGNLSSKNLYRFNNINKLVYTVLKRMNGSRRSWEAITRITPERRGGEGRGVITHALQERRGGVITQCRNNCVQ